MGRFRRIRVIHPEGGEILVKQSLSEETDINKIVERYAEYGTVPILSNPKFGDFTDGFTYHDVMSAVKEAEVDFLRLPARVRDLCENDVSVFLDKVFTEDGRKELEAAGLVKDQVPEQAVPSSEKAPEVPGVAQEGT